MSGRDEYLDSLSATERAIWIAAFSAAWVTEYSACLDDFGVERAAGTDHVEEASAIADVCIEQARALRKVTP